MPASDAGILSKLNVCEGDMIKKGQVLAAIDDRLVRFDNETAILEHQIARLHSENDVDERYAVKSLQVAQSELRRSIDANQLYKGSVSQTEIERQQMLVDRSTLTIEQAHRDRQVAALTERVKDQTIQATTRMHIEHVVI